MDIRKKLVKETIERISKDKNEPLWLMKKRKEAFEYFKNHELPTFKYGISIKTDAADMNKIEMAPKLNSYQYNIKNDDGLIVETIDQALRNHEEIIKNHFMKSIKMSSLTALHIATFTNGLFIYVPKNFQGKSPILIESIMRNSYQAEYILVITERNSNATIIQNFGSDVSRDINYKSIIIEAFIGENSKLEYITFQNFQQNILNFSIKEGVIEKNGKLNWLDCLIGSKLTISSVNSLLYGEGSSTNNWGFFFGADEQQFDLNVSAIHAAPNTYSDLITKGALNNKAKIIYRGLIKINDNAKGSNGYQKDDTLLLSEEAEADAIPNLEIGNNDVKCSHGATIGQIDQEQLFYMMSRGITEKNSVVRIVEGFFEPMLEKVELNDVQIKLRKAIEAKISK